MQKNHRFLYLSLAAILAALVLSAAISPESTKNLVRKRIETPPQGYLSEGSAQTSPCMSILMEAAQKAGVKGILGNTRDDAYEDGTHGCLVQFAVSDGTGDATSTVLALNEGQPTPDESCEFIPIDQHQLTTFHGYNARTHFSETELSCSDESCTFAETAIEWCMHKGGRSYYLMVFTSASPIEELGPPQDPLPIANVFLSIAEDRLPLSEAPADGSEQPLPPANPGGEIPGQMEVPADPNDPTRPTDPNESDGLFDIPLAVILGSLGIPVVGALAGAVMSTLLSGSTTVVSTTGSTSAGASPPPVPTADPKIGDVNQQGQYWAERPWDEAGPGFVPKEEYERTKNFLEKGYKWDHGNWRASEEIRQNEQWEQNDRDAVAREDASQRAKTEEDRKASQEKKPEPTKEDPDLLKEINMFDLNDDLDLIDDDLKKDKNYVLNPYQGDPTLIGYGINTSKNIIWDNTAGHITGDQGLTCEGYVKKTYKKVAKAVSKRFPGAKIEKYVIEEKSSVHPKGVLDWFDSLASDNHNLIKVTLPDGSEWAVDFHQKNAGKSPIMRPWSETRRIWEAYMGDEYMEGPLELR